MATKWTKEMILAKLDTNPVMVERSLIVIYNRQTQDEKVTQGTTQNNGMGFNGADAPIMSKFAEWVLKGAEKGIPEGKRLSEKQRALTVKKLRKYATQLAKVANAKG